MRFKLIESIDQSNLSDIIEFNNTLNNYDYGYYSDKDNKLITTDLDNNWDIYKTVSPENFEEHHGGICWDYVAYEAKYFKDNFPDITYHTWMLICDVDENTPTHTCLIFKYENKWYWFESSFGDYQGVWECTGNEKDLLSYIANCVAEYNKLDLATTDIYTLKYNALDSNLFNISGDDYLKFFEDKIQLFNPSTSKYEVVKVN